MLVGNLDEKVTDRVLYDILIQAGPVIHLHIPRDRETDKPKGFAFAEYETEEIANYAVRLFSGLVTLYNRTLKFGVCFRSLAHFFSSFLTISKVFLKAILTHGMNLMWFSGISFACLVVA